MLEFRFFITAKSNIWTWKVRSGKPGAHYSQLVHQDDWYRLLLYAHVDIYYIHGCKNINKTVEWLLVILEELLKEILAFSLLKSNEMIEIRAKRTIYAST